MTHQKYMKKHQQAWQLYQSGKLDGAINLYRTICNKDTRDDRAYAMLGIIYGQIGKIRQAEVCLRHAIIVNPGNIDACINHGLALLSMGLPEQAVTSYKMALHISPDNINALVGLGNAYAMQDQLTHAEASYRQVLVLDPDNKHANGNIANVLAYQGKPEEAVGYYRKALLGKPSNHGMHSNMLLCLHYISRYNPQSIFEEHRQWARNYESGVKAYSEYISKNNGNNKLRIGYVTPDLRGHSVAYFIEPLLRAHDRTRFEIYCYVEAKIKDNISEHLWELPDLVCVTANLTDTAVAELIHKDGIDILIDLAGHTENNRLPVFARKPAPIQVTYLGYPDTTGMNSINYRITDYWADPPGETERFHTEVLLRMNSGFLCFQPPEESPSISQLPALVNGYITFGSFNVLTKITPEMLSIWAKLLGTVESSRLLIKNKQLSDKKLHDRIINIFQEMGIGSERIDLQGKTTKVEHMSMYSKVDIALDTFPYNGTTTTCDTLWMGVPVISMAGKTHVSRVGVSLLTCVGLEEFICTDQDDYVERAIKLSSEIDRLSILRGSLRERMKASSLCDATSFTREFEGLLSSVWHQSCI